MKNSACLAVSYACKLLFPSDTEGKQPKASEKSDEMYDLKNLAKLDTLNARAPEAMKAFWAFDKAAMADGAIPVKYKELMAVAIALTTQCPYCIEIHSTRAKEAGATANEIAETITVAAALRAGAAVTHGTHATS